MTSTAPASATVPNTGRPDTGVAMRVLVSQRVEIGPYDDPRDALEHTYVTWLERHGLVALPVSNAAAAVERAFSDDIGGLVLTGGTDLHPATWGSAAEPTASASTTRDRVERVLLDRALAQRIPVLGLCRGMQFLNVYFGGGLVTDLRDQPASSDHAPGTMHDVVVQPAPGVDLGVTRFEVNSFHRQAVTRGSLSAELRAFLWAAGTDIVEGLYHPTLPVAGVQFHPERRTDPHPTETSLLHAFRDRRLFWAASPPATSA